MSIFAEYGAFILEAEILYLAEGFWINIIEHLVKIIIIDIQ